MALLTERPAGGAVSDPIGTAFVDPSRIEALDFVRQVIQAEAEAIEQVARSLDEAIVHAAQLIRTSHGTVQVTGVGKSGRVGHKLADTLASTGTPAHVLHPTDALHGDLGRIRPGDVVLALSQSGETEELLRLIPALRDRGALVVGITERPTSSLGRGSDLCIALGTIREADPLGLAPTSSTTAMMAVGDALALLVSRLRGFGRDDFARSHPAGSLGRKLGAVVDLMRTDDQLRLARTNQTVREVFAQPNGRGRRIGAVVVLDTDGRLAGIFTDSDHARLFQPGSERLLDRPIAEVMTRDPICIGPEATVGDALDLLADRKLSELPVVDTAQRLLGVIDVTDLIGIGLVAPEPSEE